MDFVLSFCENGEDVAVISDAGMPCINDPGNVLVNALKDKNYPYTVLSGASAFVNAFVLFGLLAALYLLTTVFAGKEKNERDKLLDGASGVSVFYVSVHDIKENMAYLLSRFGDRECCLVKEISKTHERARFCRLSDEIDDDKGEFVLVVNRQAEENPLCALSVEEHLNYYVNGGMTKNDAVKAVARDRNVPKNEIYKYTIKK